MKKLLISLDSFLVFCVSLLISVLIFNLFKNQIHERYLLDLNEKSIQIAQNIKTNIEENNIYSPSEKLNENITVYSTKQQKMTFKSSNQLNSLFFNRYFKTKDDFVVVSVYENTEVNTDYLLLGCVLLNISLYLSIIFILFLFNRNKLNEKNMSEKIKQLYLYDNLTQLLNKNSFTEKIKEKIKQGNKFHIIAVDLIDFKRINNLIGYHGGDSLLKEYAKRLNEHKDIIFPTRLNSDKFIFLVESENIKSEIQQISYDLTSNPFIINDEFFQIKQIVGVSSFPTDSLLSEDLIKLAEISMHTAKDVKTNIIFYKEEIGLNLSKNNIIKTELPLAINRNEMFLVFQPKIKKDDNSIYAEVLTRWNSKKLGFVSPDLFIETAEKTGDIHKLGKWIFTESVKQMSIFKKEGFIINLSINLSPKQLLNNKIVEEFKDILNFYNISANNITLEITENSMMNEKEYSKILLEQLSKEGFKISIDDFGKGHSSLSYLKDYPIDEIKIDKSFVDEIISSDFNSHLVETISNLAKKTNKTLVVEGVETIEQVNKLLKLGCYCFQGYFYSKPLNKEQFAEYVFKKNQISKN